MRGSRSPKFITSHKNRVPISDRQLQIVDGCKLIDSLGVSLNGTLDKPCRLWNRLKKLILESFDRDVWIDDIGDKSMFYLKIVQVRNLCLRVVLFLVISGESM